MCNIISPTSLLLSATGTLAFKNCGLSDEVSAFAAPEMLQDRAGSTKPATDKVSARVPIPQVQVNDDDKLLVATFEVI